MATIQLPTFIERLRNRVTSFLSKWLEPRSTNRDAAFREKIIRSTLILLIPFTLLSTVLTVTVFNNPWGIVSFPTLHIVFLIGCVGSAIAVAQDRLRFSGWLLVITLLIGAGGVVLLARQAGDINALVVSGLPAFMIAPVITSLVLPRRLIVPIGLLAIITYLIAQFAIPITGDRNVNLEADKISTTTLLLIMVESIFLRQLRVEFDARFEDMRKSMEQTEQSRKEAEVARKRAEAADNAKSQFLANMSHELRTPLNAIIGYSEAMIGGMAGAFTDKQAMLLNHIQHNGRRLLALINDILDLSKIESGSLEVFLSPMTLESTFHQTVDSVRSLADNKNIYLKVEFVDAVPEIVLSDSRKLEQIIVNLLSNAIKFTDEGGVLVKVSSVDKENWRFTVEDTGIGMPEGASQYIFEPFKQVDGSTTRKHKGTGLGLAITKRLVDHLGGKIDVKSELKQGTSFAVTFPIAYVPKPSAMVKDETQ